MTHAHECTSRDPVLLRCTCPPDALAALAHKEWPHLGIRAFVSGSPEHLENVAYLAALLRRVRDEALEEAAHLSFESFGTCGECSSQIGHSIRALKERAP